MTFSFALALACVTGSHVSGGNFFQKAALSNDSGLIVADGYKKWNVSAFLRSKVEPGGCAAEALLKDEGLAGN